MSHPRQSPVRFGMRPRRHRSEMVQFMRGLVMETLGVAALGFLYLTMQASAAGELDGGRPAESGKSGGLSFHCDSLLLPSAGQLLPSPAAREPANSQPFWLSTGRR